MNSHQFKIWKKEKLGQIFRYLENNKSLKIALKLKKHKTCCLICERGKINKYCEYCKKETGNLFKIVITDTVKVRESICIEQRMTGVKKYFKKVFQGYEPSNNYKKYPEGVEKYQNVDRENNWYDKIVKDNRTGTIIRKIHEPLDKHVSSADKKKQGLIFKMLKFFKIKK